MSKYSKKRPCPAAGHEISTADCGEGRGSRYACPADCPHSPWAPFNYLQLLELEDGLDRKCMDYLLAHAPDRAALERALQMARHAPSPHALHAFYAWNLFFAADADGRSCAQHWEQSDFGGLKNDERVLLRAKMHTRIALLEIRRVLDYERLEAMDLLDANAVPFILQDRRLARVAVRFATAVVWIYPLPHYWRLSGTAVLLPDFGRFEPREIVTETVRHLGGPTDEVGLRRWLAEHLVRFDESLMATGRMRRARMFAGLDAKYGKAVYELQAPFAECRAQLDALPSVEPESLGPTERAEGFAETWVWFDDTPATLKQAVPPGGRAVLGRVLLGQAHWRVEAMGAEKFKRFRDAFEAVMGQRVRFTGERLDNIAASLGAKEPATDESLVPPRLLEEPQRVVMSTSRVPKSSPGASPAAAEADFMQAADRAFLDDHVPALNDHTPREAARDPALRPELIRLLKQRVRGCDEFNLRTGQDYDINWLLRELGAQEILFDPPPLRPTPEPLRRDDDSSVLDAFEDDEFVDEAPEPDWSLPLAPPLPKKSLDFEEALRRLEAGRKILETPDDAWEWLTDAGIKVVDHADRLTADFLSDEDFSFVTIFLVQAAQALVPPGHRAPPTSYESLLELFTSNMKGLEQALNAGNSKVLMKYLEQGSQPALVGLICGQMMEVATSAPKNIRPKPDSQPIMLGLVKSVVEELDRVLRP